MSAGWSGTGCATSRTLTPASASRASTTSAAWIIKDVPELRIVDERALGAGQGAARRDASRKLRAFARAAAPAHTALRPAAVRRLRRRLRKVSQSHYRLLDGPQQGHLRQPADDPRGTSSRAWSWARCDPPDGPGAVRGVLRGVHRQRNTLRRRKERPAVTARGEHAELAESAKLIQAIKDGVPAAEVKDDLARIGARRERARGAARSHARSRVRCCIRHGANITAGRWRAGRGAEPARTGTKRPISCAA